MFCLPVCELIHLTKVFNSTKCQMAIILTDFFHPVLMNVRCLLFWCKLRFVFVRSFVRLNENVPSEILQSFELLNGNIATIEMDNHHPLQKSYHNPYMLLAVANYLYNILYKFHLGHSLFGNLLFFISHFTLQFVVFFYSSFVCLSSKCLSKSA